MQFLYCLRVLFYFMNFLCFNVWKSLFIGTFVMLALYLKLSHEKHLRAHVLSRSTLSTFLSSILWTFTSQCHVKINTSQIIKASQVDMANSGLGQVNWITGQVGSDWPFFHMIFLKKKKIKKTTCICYLDSHVTNYLM